MWYAKKKKVFLLLLSGAFAIMTFWLLHAVFQESQQVDFNTQIRPIFNKKCITCHGGVKRSAEFSLLFPSEAFSPNESGKPAIVPGKPQESEMIRRIKHHDPEVRMPSEGDPLPKVEIELLIRWIEQGAQWEDHWAYVKPEPITLPDVSSDWIGNEIDRFILRKLEENELQPSPQADKATLLRRVSLDLIGLPPTWEEVRDFQHDNSPDAYEKVVDRLLKSPHFGERLAAMWMDLARYADSKGYEADGARSIWQYRDWLIKAFNEDKPFDQFTIEQLAGDLLPNPTDAQLIATAFHRNTMNNEEGGTEDEEFRVAAVIDRVNTTWEVWQATTMGCVQCHSHPYDPIRHEDYYKSYAFFNNTADEDVPGEYPMLKTFTKKEDWKSLESIKNWVILHTPIVDEKLEKVRDFEELIRLTEPKIHPHSFDQIEKGTLTGYNYLSVESGGYVRIKQVPLKGKTWMLVSYSADRSNGVVEVRTDSLHGKLLTTWQIKKNKGGGNFETISLSIQSVPDKHNVYLIFKDPDEGESVCLIEWVLFHDALPGKDQPGYGTIKREFFRLLNQPEALKTPVMVENEQDFQRKAYVFERGNWMVHGEEVEPGVPKAWNSLPEGAPQNRLGLARWLVSKDNPLTARVMVNRLWAKLFGIGIVETVEDFGSQGFPPSHPQLLDWLAQQFMYENKWSIKKQLKQMVMSATYQQASIVTPELLAIDPDNRLLARGPRIRLSAEQVRDQALAVSGLLSEKMYGPSVMPTQPEGVWQVIYSGQEWKTSEGDDKYRRALYTYWRRTSPYPSMIAFDSPSREFCVMRRIDTNTPLQALVTLNDPVYLEAAQALAVRMQSEDRVEEQIKKGYRLAMVREIDAIKLHKLQLLYEEALHHFEEHPQAAAELTGQKNIMLATLTVVANALMNLDEFITKS